MSELAYVFDAVRLGASGLLVIAGLVLMLGGAIGLLRFPDFYTRLHAAGVADALGAVIIIGGLAFAAWDWRVTLKLLLLAALLAALAPLLSQLLANAAHSGGLAPIAGRYLAPRPGPRRKEGET